MYQKTSHHSSHTHPHDITGDQSLQSIVSFRKWLKCSIINKNTSCLCSVSVWLPDSCLCHKNCLWKQFKVIYALLSVAEKFLRGRHNFSDIWDYSKRFFSCLLNNQWGSNCKTKSNHDLLSHFIPHETQTSELTPSSSVPENMTDSFIWSIRNTTRSEKFLKPLEKLQRADDKPCTLSRPSPCLFSFRTGRGDSIQ